MAIGLSCMAAQTAQEKPVRLNSFGAPFSAVFDLTHQRIIEQSLPLKKLKALKDFASAEASLTNPSSFHSKVLFYAANLPISCLQTTAVSTPFRVRNEWLSEQRLTRNSIYQ